MPGRRSTFAPAATALLLAAVPCFGWGRDGHRVIGYVAAVHLSADARAYVEGLLGSESLAEASNWADEIRGDSSYDWAKPLHYVNLPPGDSVYEMRRDCTDGRCVVEAINRYAAVLRGGTASGAEQVEALKFLAHFVGDVHQPLHVAYERDRGGNSINVVFFGERMNLHRLWDTGLLVRSMAGGTPEAYAQRLNAGLTDVHRDDLMSELDPAAWANESFAITRDDVYVMPPDRRLDDEYFGRSIGVVDRRLADAGVRLAAILNDITAPRVAIGPAGFEPGGDDGEDAGQYVEIVLGDPCGSGGGREAHIINRHESKPIRIEISKSWLDNGTTRSRTGTLVVRPGEQNMRRLGCTEVGRPGQSREFSWSIVMAVFR